MFFETTPRGVSEGLTALFKVHDLSGFESNFGELIVCRIGGGALLHG